MQGQPVYSPRGGLFAQPDLGWSKQAQQDAMSRILGGGAAGQLNPSAPGQGSRPNLLPGQSFQMSHPASHQYEPVPRSASWASRPVTPPPPMGMSELSSPTYAPAGSGIVPEFPVHRGKRDVARDIASSPSSSFNFDDDDEENALISWWRLAIMAICWAFCLVAWLIGILSYSATLTVLPDTDFSKVMTKNVLQTLHDLVNRRIFFSFGVLFFFSIVVPVIKIVGYLWFIRCLMHEPPRAVFEAHRVLAQSLVYLASYQMLDMYVSLYFVSFFNSKACNAVFLPGFYWFVAYCLVSMFVSVLLEWCMPYGFMKSPIIDLQRHGPLIPRGSRKKPRGAQQGIPCMPESDLRDISQDNLESHMGYKSRPDTQTVFFFTIAAGVLALCSVTPSLLEVRSMFNGVTIDRHVLSLQHIFVVMLPSLTQPWVLAVVFLFNIVLPVLYALCLACASCMREDPDNNDDTCLQFGVLLCDVLRPWVTTDVFALATLIFLFTLQDEHNQTGTPPGSYAFFLLLGSGLAVFMLRWFTDRGDEDESSDSADAMPSGRFILRVAAWAALTLLAILVVPSATPNVQFQGLSSICRSAQPLMNRAFTDLPASYGACDDAATNPPQPCYGHDMIYRENTSEGFVDAKWISGLNTMTFDGCHLEKTIIGNNLAPTEYSLFFSGKFSRLDLFLHLHKCGAFGCTDMNSADHCCGEDIKFNFTFDLRCSLQPLEIEAVPNEARKVLDFINISDAEIDPMLVQASFMGGALMVDALDISPTLEVAIRTQVAAHLAAFRVQWGGRGLELPEFLDQIVHLNAPEPTCP